MIHKPSVISLFNKIEGQQLIAEDEIRILNFGLSYINDNEIIDIDVDSNKDLSLGDIAPQWSASMHNLNLKLDLEIDKPWKFFDESGVTSKSNKIGIAALVYSRSSNMQETLRISSFGYQKEKFKCTLDKDFEVGSIRGQVNIEIFFYLDEVNETLPYQADKVGMILSNGSIYEIELYIDGDGSEFPITEIEESGGPLWLLDMKWVDASEDVFDINNITLKFNKKHRLYESVVEKPSNRILNNGYQNEIVVQAMIAVISQVILVEKKDISEESVQNSILKIVTYWIETFDIDTTSISTISNTLRTAIDKKVRG